MKKLTIYEPVIRTYLRQAYPTSILGDIDWIYDKYIQLLYNCTNKNNIYIAYAEDTFFDDEGVFFKGYHLFPYKRKKKLIDEMIRYIDEEWYIFGQWDESKIPGTYYYFAKQAYNHRNLLYGYAREEEVFFTQGYLADWKWHRYCVSFQDYLGALVNQDGKICFETYRKNKNLVLTFSVKRFAHELQKYVKSIGKDKKGSIFGYEGVCLYLKELLTYYDRDITIIDQTSIYIFYERANSMRRRLKLLCVKGFISSQLYEKGLALCNKFCHEYDKMIKLMLKYNYKPKSIVLRELSNLGLKTVMDEKIFFDEILSYIEVWL